MKMCKGCNQDKFDSDFHSNVRNKDGLAYYCRDCTNARARARHKAKVRTDETRRKENEYIRLYRYGVTPERYNKMMSEQGNKCAVCKTEFGDIRACIDHDHNCCPGKRSCGLCVRGLLCVNCNLAAGYIETRFSYMEDMFRYLRLHLEARNNAKTQGGEY